MQKTGDSLEGIGLYFHIPFCSRKCPYCHFYVIPYREEFEKKLLQGLDREWHYRQPLIQDKSIKTIYFGGGTPSLLPAVAFADLLSKIACQAEEITLEVNPETVSLDKMKEFRTAGINRISLGVQSLDDRELHLLGRQHAAKKAIDAVQIAAEAGFENISIDLMFELPGQTLASWERTLDRVVDLPITHLSLYNLTFEPHTQFFKRRRTLEALLPDETERLNMLQMAVGKLPQAGLHRYEISAFAKSGYHSRHNSGYWLARPFMGFGPSAFSYWEGKRFQNACSLQQWADALEGARSPVEFEEQLPPPEAFNELLAVQLRMLDGVNLKKFQERHGTMPEATSMAIEKLIKQEWLTPHGDQLCLSEQGLLFYDSVATEIL